MIKNYFGKAVVAVTMLAGFTLTSCDKEDNSIVINGQEYYKSEVVYTKDGATVKANTPFEVSRMLSKIREDMNEKLNDGQDYVITIETPAPIEATETDNSISVYVPSYKNAKNNAKIVLKFANGISANSEVPLKLLGKGQDGYSASWTSSSNIDINIPSASSGASLDLQFPNSTVTLKPEKGSVTLDEVKSVTARNTLVIEKNVTINWLINDKNSSAIVMKGGQVNGFLYNQNYWYATFRAKGVTNNTYYNDEEAEEQPSKGEPYYSQNLKVMNTGWSCGMTIDNDWDYEKGKSLNGKGVEPIIVIEEGAKANINWNRHSYEVEVEDEYGTHTEWWDQCEPFVGSITGEGEDAMITSGDLRTVKKLENVTVESNYDLVLPNKAEDCVFNSNPAQDWNNFVLDIREASFDTASFTNCKFGLWESDNEPADNHVITFNIATTKKVSSFEWLFDNCEFTDQFQFAGGAWLNKKGDSVTISFIDTKMNGKAISSKNLLNQIWTYDEKNPQPFFNINGKVYVPSLDEKKGEWSLVEKK